MLSNEAVFAYKVDNTYAPSHDSGILWNDESLAIDWILDSNEIKLSAKDEIQQKFNDFESPFGL